MDLPKNHFKHAIMEGRQQIGLWSSIPDASVTEMLAGTGFDWLLLDCEHSPSDPIKVLDMLRAAAPYPVMAAARPVANDAAEIKRLLDIGVQTLIVPYVQTREEAEYAAAAVAYPPDGMRGVSGLSRSSRYGAVPDYFHRAREEICLIVQIETAQGVENLEQIASTPGIDGIFIGPADLGASLGTGRADSPETQSAVIDCIRRVRAAGKPAGVLAMDDGFLGDLVEAGSLFTATGIDLGLLRKAALERVARWKG